MAYFYRGFAGLALLPLLIVSAPLYAAEQAVFPKQAAMDSNKDGKPDLWQYFEGGNVVRAEADTNGDGRIDEISHFKEGKIVKSEKDADFDGKMDQWLEY